MNNDSLSSLLIYKGKTVEQLYELFNLSNCTVNIKQLEKLSRLMLKDNELLGSNTELRVIKLENNYVSNDVPLVQYGFKKTAVNSYENSELYDVLKRNTFLFMVFVQKNQTHYFEKGMYWSIDETELKNIVKYDWEKIREAINTGISFEVKYNKNGKATVKHSLSELETSIIASKNAKPNAYKLNCGYSYGNINAHSYMLPDGQYMTRQQFVLNRGYIFTKFNLFSNDFPDTQKAISVLSNYLKEYREQRSSSFYSLEYLSSKHNFALYQDFTADSLSKYMNENYEGRHVLGYYIDRYLEERKMTMAELEKKLTRVRTTVERNLNEEKKISRQTLSEIAIVLKLTVEQFNELAEMVGQSVLSKYSDFDVAVKCFLNEHISDPFDINQAMKAHGIKPALFEYGKAKRKRKKDNQIV